MELNDVDILGIMPPNIAADNNVQMMAQAFNEVLREIIAKIPNLAIIPRLVRKEIVDHTLLDLLAWGFNTPTPFYRVDLPIEKKQDLISKTLDWYTRKGTPAMIEEIATIVFDECEIQEWFEYGGLPYRFRITTAETVEDMAAIGELVRAIYLVKNTRSFIDTITAMIQARMTLHTGIGVVFKDRLTLHTTVTKRETGKVYNGIIPDIRGRIDILSAD